MYHQVFPKNKVSSKLNFEIMKVNDKQSNN